jgi:oxygen-independent coproporphyrinogen III oxidase
VNSLLTRPTPRYTSYPPHPRWNNQLDVKRWIESVANASSNGECIDLYVHIPFCEKLCFYCGCNQVIKKNHEQDREFVISLLDEWDIYRRVLSSQSMIRSLHLGGGTPTFLSAELLEMLLSHLSSRFHHNFNGSAELDPRTTTRKHLKVLSQFGIRKVSFGIQDFDPLIQKVINREQPFELVQSVVAMAREEGIRSINFDLIYGLPYQTCTTVEKTVTQVLDLGPDIICIFSYAHYPEKMPNQRLIDKYPRFEGDKKEELLESFRRPLIESGYMEIGLDHFAKRSDPLAQAYKDRRVKRSFMGHVEASSSVLLGLGPSSIGSTPDAYFQNERRPETYLNSIRKGELPLVWGHVIGPEDKQINRIIEEFMCYGQAPIDTIKDNYPHLLSSSEFSFLVQDELIKIENDHIYLTIKGQPYRRVIATVLDPHYS